MSRIAYVNGRYRPWRDATVHVEDRGYQFSDGVYEVCEVRGGRMVDERRHMARLERSLAELRMAMPMSPAALGVVMRETIRRNRVDNGIVYLQVSRGVARRDHAFPPSGTAPAVVVTARSLDGAGNEAMAEKGVAVVTVPDNRWGRVDIKSISLLPNVLAKQAAREQGAREAWFVDRDGNVTEGSSSNAWIVTADGEAGHARRRQRDPARHHPRRADRRDLGAGPDLRGTPIHGCRGAGRPRGLPDLGDPDRDADRADRRQAGRRGQAGAGRTGSAAGLPPPCRMGLTAGVFPANLPRFPPTCACAAPRGAL